jgi:arylsulfatase A-like enzyme
MLTRHSSNTLVLLAATLSLANIDVRADDAPARQPNVILFLVDDMGWMDCGAYGSKYYETPHIDRFATRAMRFTDAYAQPLCSPTRASLLTGRYSARHGITSATGHQPPQPAGHRYLPETGPPTQAYLAPQSKNFLEPSEYTLAEALRDAGYRTAHIGKWHLGLTRPYWPEQQGFEVAFHCHPDPGPPGNYFSPYGVISDGEPRGQQKVGTITDGPAGEYIVDRLADEAIRFIETNRDRPFFLNLWNYGVHGPWGHKPEYTRAFAQKHDPRGVQGNPIMASMLGSVDECFGRVLEALDRNGVVDNTIVVFNSDNGGNTHSNTEEDTRTRSQTNNPRLADWRKWAGTQPPTNNAPLRDGKGTLYEGGTRVPLMWSWTGHIPAGTTSDAVVGHIDLYPTLLDLLKVPRPEQQQLDGVSYAPVLQQNGTLERTAFFNYFPHGRSPGRAGGVWVRSGDWKLIRWFGLAEDDPARLELYNLREDLGESMNRAAADPARVQIFDALITGFLDDTGATCPRANPAFQASASRPAAANAAADPLEGWKARQCEAVVKDGVLTMTGKGNAPFLGHGMGRTNGPAVVNLRVRSPSGGAGRVEWLPGGAGDATGAKSVPFEFAAGDWRDVSVEVPATGALGVVRLYLPAASEPVELDWIEVRAQGGKAQRWDFKTP